MPILIVGIAQAKALMLDLASPAASKREKGRITTYPLLTTRRFDQRRLGITTKPAMLASNRLGFHAIVGHGLSWFGGGELNPPSYRRIGASRRGVFYAEGSSSVQPAPPSMAWGHRSCPRGTRHEPMLHNETPPDSVEEQAMSPTA